MRAWPDYDQAALRSALNAYYTDRDVIRAVWDWLDAQGVSVGHGWEPGCGRGDWIAAAPAAVSFDAVDVDPISVTVARELTGANVVEGRLEEWDVGRSSRTSVHGYDVAIGNVPFLSTPPGVNNPHRDSLHNLALWRAARMLRPGGVAEPAECPDGNLAVIAWADTQLGAPYAAADSYRFGVPFPGGTITGFRGDRYTYAKGTVAYDCSGFVITAYQQIGVDFTAIGLYGSQAFNTDQLPDAEAPLQPGDIAVYEPRNGVGHIVLIHHTDPNGTIHTIEAAAGKGVYIGELNLHRTTAIKRPPTP